MATCGIQEGWNGLNGDIQIILPQSHVSLKHCCNNMATCDSQDWKRAHNGKVLVDIKELKVKFLSLWLKHYGEKQ
jgi:hypothetical protein